MMDIVERLRTRRQMIDRGNGDVQDVADEDCEAAATEIERLRSSVPSDVRELVIAARLVAFQDQSPGATKRLDRASEAFASRVPWEDESK